MKYLHLEIYIFFIILINILDTIVSYILSVETEGRFNNWFNLEGDNVFLSLYVVDFFPDKLILDDIKSSVILPPFTVMMFLYCGHLFHTYHSPHPSLQFQELASSLSGTLFFWAILSKKKTLVMKINSSSKRIGRFVSHSPV